MFDVLITGIKSFFALAGVILALLILAIAGVVVMFIGYFVLWGLVGFIFLSFIWFLLWCWFTEEK